MRCLAAAALLALVVCLAACHLFLFTAWYSFGRKLFTRVDNVHFKDIERAIQIAGASHVPDGEASAKERRLALLFMLRTNLVEIELWRRWLQPGLDMTGHSDEHLRVSLYFHVADGFQAAGPDVVAALQALPGTRKVLNPVGTGWCELMAAEVALLQAALMDDPGAEMFVLLPHDAGLTDCGAVCMHQAASKVCMDKASASALRGGVAAAVVQAICVPAFMWMRTVTNYQYRHGGRVLDVARRLYAEGGPRRFYRGVVPALVQSPILRFGGLAVNEGLLSATANHSLSHTATAALSSAAATGLKILLMPLDAWQTAKQVNGQQGLALLMVEAKSRPLSLWRGTAGCLTGTWIAHYAWCFTNNWLHDTLPVSAFGNSEMARQDMLFVAARAVITLCRGASIGFAANVAGDCCIENDTANRWNFHFLPGCDQGVCSDVAFQPKWHQVDCKELQGTQALATAGSKSRGQSVASSQAFLIGYEAVLRQGSIFNGPKPQINAHCKLQCARLLPVACKLFPVPLPILVFVLEALNPHQRGGIAKKQVPHDCAHGILARKMLLEAMAFRIIFIHGQTAKRCLRCCVAALGMGRLALSRRHALRVASARALKAADAIFESAYLGEPLCSDEVLPLLTLALAEEQLSGSSSDMELSDLPLYQKAAKGLQFFEDGLRDLGVRAECILYAPWPGCGVAEQPSLKRAKSPLLGGGLLPADRDALLQSLADMGVLFARKLGTSGGNVTAHLAMLHGLDSGKRPQAPHRLFPLPPEERGGPIVLTRWYLASLKARLPPAAIVVLCGCAAVLAGQLVIVTGVISKKNFTVLVGVYVFAHFVVFFVSVAAFVEYSLLEPLRKAGLVRKVEL
ncbi:unnamed protein product [Symbiodinium natans]|uniref:Uncharacterized protein n=1 Tax=Symbiodinium natans TaxID=878477 RepID=A0A812I2E7_9DINO|nr:unnamed protein product [Symbiodinium natans]